QLPPLFGEFEDEVLDLLKAYEIVGVLGKGGLGTVLRARPKTRRGQVAIKLLRLHESLGERAFERFKLEALLTSRLTHPNIATAHGIGRSEHFAYYVRRLVE